MESPPGDTALLEPVESVQSIEATVPGELLSFRDAAFRFAVRITGNVVDADDIVQEAYLRLLKFEGKIRPGPEARTLLLRVVANLARNAYASDRRRVERERKVAGAIEPAGNPESMRNDLRSALERALKSLPENMRLPVCLHYEQGLSYADASKILNVPEDTLRVYAQRGVQSLRNKLAREGYAISPALLLSFLVGGDTISSAARSSIVQVASTTTRGIAGKFAVALLSASAAAIVVGAQISRSHSVPTSSTNNSEAVALVTPTASAAPIDRKTMIMVDGIVTGSGGANAASDNQYCLCKKGEQWRVNISIERPDVAEPTGRVYNDACGTISIYDSNGTALIDLQRQPVTVHYVFQGAGAIVMTPITWHGKSAHLSLNLNRSPAGMPNNVQIEVHTATDLSSPSLLNHVNLYHCGSLNGPMIFNR